MFHPIDLLLVGYEVNKISVLKTRLLMFIYKDRRKTLSETLIIASGKKPYSLCF